jgi:hypothetical protein
LNKVILAKQEELANNVVNVTNMVSNKAEFKHLKEIK